VVIRGKQVRFVHLPASFDPFVAVREHRGKLDAARRHYREQVVFGPKHAAGTDTRDTARALQPSTHGDAAGSGCEASTDAWLIDVALVSRCACRVDPSDHGCVVRPLCRAARSQCRGLVLRLFLPK
jgi:hypothetical protein